MSADQRARPCHQGRDPRRGPRDPLPARPPRPPPRRCCRSSTSRRSSTSSRSRSAPGSTTSSSSPAATRPRSRTTSTTTGSSSRRSRPRATSTGSSGCASRRRCKVHFVRQGQPKGLGHAVHVRQGARRRQPVRRAARRRPHRRARPPARGDARGARGEGWQRRRPDGGARRSRSTSTAAPPSSRVDGRDVVRITGLVEKPDAGRRAEQPRRHRPLRPGPVGLRGAASTPRPAAAARSSSPTRCRTLRRLRRARRRRARRGLPRPPLRHRRPARLPQGRGPARRSTTAELGERLRRVARRLRADRSAGVSPR